MADDDLGKDLAAAFEADEQAATGEDPKPPEAVGEDPNKKPENPATPPAEPPKPEEPKKDDPATPEDPKKPEEPKKDEEKPGTLTDPAKKPEEGAEPPKIPEAPAEPATPQPLTKDDVKDVVRDIRTEERSSGKVLSDKTEEVLSKYYPEGLSDVLTTPDGKQLKTPQDVVDASNGEMSVEEATQWLMNEQYKLKQDVDQIRSDASKIAETDLNFRRDSITAVKKYAPLFEAYPQLQERVFNKLMKLVKVDDKRELILSSPDVLEFYDDYLDPYRLAFEHQKKQSATNPTPDAPATPAEPAKPGAADRMDEGGDGGATTEVDDPNDFAQQVNKELAKPL